LSQIISKSTLYSKVLRCYVTLLNPIEDDHPYISIDYSGGNSMRRFLCLCSLSRNEGIMFLPCSSRLLSRFIGTSVASQEYWTIFCEICGRWSLQPTN